MEGTMIALMLCAGVGALARRVVSLLVRGAKPQIRTTIVLMLCAGALASPAMGADPIALAGDKQCFICHDGKSDFMIGPPFRDIARRYKGVSDAKTKLAGVIQSGTEGHWAASKMPAASERVPVSKEEAEVLAEYVLSFK